MRRGLKSLQQVNNKLIKEAADKVYHYMTTDNSSEWGMDIHKWDWVPGVGVISILHYHQNCSSKDAFDFLVQWVETNQLKAQQNRVINSMAPYAIFPDLYRQTGNRAYLDAATEIGQWMVNKAPRTREGAFEHTVTENASFPEQVWGDTLFMAVLFLARLARLTGKESFAREALNQSELHLRLLQDPESGVLFHGWNCAEKNHMSAAKWTRANAWAAAGVPEILQEIKDLVDIPFEIKQRYKRMVNGLITFQGKNGLWHTVMDRSDFYQETSGSAGIACGIVRGIRQGLLDDSYQAVALNSLIGVLSQLDDNGMVNGVSGGTPVMPTIGDYNEISVIPSLYGQGLTLMLLSEFLA
ncbi:MAG: glycosyl hydrolase [Bacilli bacterium]|nr:glycosyl hydrolase [Bacilli bacterium]